MYFVTALHPTRGHAFLAGPYRTHGAALAQVDRCSRVARTLAPVEMFDAGFGTARVVRTRRMIVGKLNDRIGYDGPGSLP